MRLGLKTFGQVKSIRVTAKYEIIHRRRILSNDSHMDTFTRDARTAHSSIQEMASFVSHRAFRIRARPPSKKKRWMTSSPPSHLLFYASEGQRRFTSLVLSATTSFFPPAYSRNVHSSIRDGGWGWVVGRRRPYSVEDPTPSKTLLRRRPYLDAKGNGEAVKGG
jgi:hypothetical protein